jgi:uncharacterized membrane protein YebE (DUF533 family)
MAGFESLFASIDAWFGFVGSCVAGGGSACRPFLAFVALTAAAGAALALLVLAYKALQQDQSRQVESSHNPKREPQSRQPVRSLPARVPSANTVPVGGWRMTA